MYVIIIWYLYFITHLDPEFHVTFSIRKITKTHTSSMAVQTYECLLVLMLSVAAFFLVFCS